MLDLRNKDYHVLCDLANKCFITPVEIWAYGSRVNGDSHDASDLDLVIRTINSIPLALGELLDFKEQLQESNIPILVQVMDWNKIPESFHNNILKKYHVIYSTGLVNKMVY